MTSWPSYVHVKRSVAFVNSNGLLCNFARSLDINSIEFAKIPGRLVSLRGRRGEGQAVIIATLSGVHLRPYSAYNLESSTHEIVLTEIWHVSRFMKRAVK